MSNPDVPFPDPIDFAALGRLDAAATPGPWHRFHDDSPGHTCNCGQIWSDHELLFSPDRSDNYPVDRVDDGRLIVAMRNAHAAYREVVVAAKDIAMSPYTDQDAAMDPEKCGRIKVLLSLVQRERLVAALARFRNVGGAS